MKRFFLALALASSAICGAERYALIVAIDSYPIIKPPARQLAGSATDLKLVRKMLEFYNFQVEQLARGDATRIAIITKLEEIRQKAKSGDQVVFYFSGRGSIAPPADQPTAKVGMEPTLVPYDGKETTTDFDLRMKRIEDWDKMLTTAGASVTVILDASFQSATRDDVGRPYNPTPRTIRRKATLDGEVRENAYLGPGRYVAATPSGGSAYEWLTNATRNTWGGAFTDFFVGKVINLLRNGQTPTLSGVLRETQAYFKDKVRQDYMPGLAPYPFPKELIEKAALYDQPLFGGLADAPVPPAKNPEVIKTDEERKQREQKLRIGLSFPTVRDRNTRGEDEPERDPKVVAEFTQLVQKSLPYAEVVPVGAPVDVVVAFVKQPTGGLEARVFGDEVDRKRNLNFPGKDVAEVMTGGLQDNLERQALTVKLFPLLDEEKPTWESSVGLVADKEQYQPNDPFSLKFSCEQPALVYIFDRDDSDGIVQMTYPTLGATDNKFEAGSRDIGGSIEEGSPAGKMLVRALFVEPSTELPAPSGATDKEYLTSLLKHLRVLVPALESKKLKWSAKEISLTVNP